jgi:hypothetical protein
MNWQRTDMEGEAIETSIIQRVIPQSVAEPNDYYFSDDGEDDVDKYTDDVVVAPAVATDDGADDDFFVSLFTQWLC